MDVGVREFKKRVSEYLEKASKGELIRVTDRGEPKAILGPVPGSSQLKRGTTEGWIRAGNGKQPTIARRFAARVRVSDTLSDDRGT